MRERSVPVDAVAAGKRALVFSGGGVAGIAWELGVLVGLNEGGIDVRDADLIVGTSAGSVVGALLASGVPFDRLFARQTMQPQGSNQRPPRFDVEEMQAALTEIIRTTPPDPQRIRARIGALALAAPTIDEAEWIGAIGSLLPVKEWPEKQLLVSVVDAQTGEWVVFDRNSGVGLVEAVAASCTVPGVWPPVAIGSRRFIDGGMRSLASADLAQGCQRVIILTPLPAAESRSLFANLQDEITLLENSGSRVLVISADEASRRAIGTNVLDPATGAPSARAGKAQGQAMAAEVRKFWQEAA